MTRYLSLHLRCLAGLGMLLIATPTWADGPTQWTLTQRTGHVQVVRPGLQPASLSLNARLLAGDVIVTGRDGRAMLTRGSDYVVVSPGSRLAVPKEVEASGMTRLIQMFGTMLYKVKPTGKPHFQVDAPMLAAVVKGTTFSVVVDDKRNAVQVVEGLVEVSSLDRRSVQLVERGRTVVVDIRRPSEVGDATKLSQEPTDERAVTVEANSESASTDVARATDGAVQQVGWVQDTSATQTTAAGLTPVRAVTVTGTTLTTTSVPATEVLTAADTAAPIVPESRTDATVSVTPVVAATTTVSTAPSTVTATVAVTPTVTTIPIVTTVPTVTVAATIPTIPIVTTPTVVTVPTVPTVPVVTVPTIPTVPSTPTLPLCVVC